jgi:hypothetical protein
MHKPNQPSIYAICVGKFAHIMCKYCTTPNTLASMWNTVQSYSQRSLLYNWSFEEEEKSYNTLLKVSSGELSAMREVKPRTNPNSFIHSSIRNLLRKM